MKTEKEIIKAIKMMKLSPGLDFKDRILALRWVLK